MRLSTNASEGGDPSETKDASETISNEMITLSLFVFKS